MNPSKRLLPALLVLAISCASAAAVSAITITSNSVGVYLQSSAGFGTNNFTGTSIPTSQLLDVTLGQYYSRIQIDYTGSGENVTLLNTFSQKRSGNQYDYSEGFDGYMYFVAGANSTYSLSGNFSAIDVTTAGKLYFSYQLYDVSSPGTNLAENYQYSLNTLDESFVVGGLGGDYDNYNFGSLTGSLIAGHQYRWSYTAFTQATPDPDGGATATGFLRLDIGGGAPSSVPDGGATLTMLGTTVLSLAVYRRKIATI